MRIIAGKYKGHKLVSFEEEHIRPMTDRVKESLFNIFMGYLDGAKVLDLYSGTGSVGLEAISRGAVSVDFVEMNLRSIKLIQKNIAILKVQDQTEIIKEDALKFINNFEGSAYDLIFIDPPFPSKICLKTLEALAVSQAVAAATKIVIEHSRQEPLPDSILSGEKSLRLVDRREYGDKILSFYDPTN